MIFPLAIAICASYVSLYLKGVSQKNHIRKKSMMRIHEAKPFYNHNKMKCICSILDLNEPYLM